MATHFSLIFVGSQYRHIALYYVVSGSINDRHFMLAFCYFAFVVGTKCNTASLCVFSVLFFFVTRKLEVYPLLQFL